MRDVLFTLLSVLVCVSVCVGILENSYIYRGSLQLGFDEIKPQFAATGIKAYLRLQMLSDREAMAKLTDIEVGTCNNDNLETQEGCKALPIIYSPLNFYKQQMEETFILKFDKRGNFEMMVAQNEAEFVTNIRKSIVESIRPRFESTKLSSINLITNMTSFSRVEETMFGKCETDYTIEKFISEEQFKLPAFIPKEVLQEIKEAKNSYLSTSLKDIYRPKSMLMVLRSSINFDKCEDRVMIQRSSLGNLTMIGHNQYKSFQTRSSQRVAIIIAAGNASEMFISYTEGSVVTNPFGFETEKVQAKTFQVMFVKESRIVNILWSLPISMKKVKTQGYEVASSSKPSAHQRRWINSYYKTDLHFPISESFLTGIDVSKSLVQTKKHSIMNLIRDAVRVIMGESMVETRRTPFSFKGAYDSTLLLEAMKAVRILPEEDIRDLLDVVFKAGNTQKEKYQKMLLIDIVAASGTTNSIRALLKSMESGRISAEQSATIWMTMANHLISPAVIPDMMKYITTMKTDRNVLLSSLAHVNFATVLNKFCINENSAYYSVQRDLYGGDVCHSKDVLQQIIPYLKSKLEKTKLSNETSYLVQTASNLGTPEAFPLFEDILFKREEKDNRIRSLAVYALEYRKMGDAVKDKVYSVLTKLFEDVREHDEMRQAAFITLLTWHPNSAWWHTMAKRTWEEKSINVAAFVSFTIKTMSKVTSLHLKEQSDMAYLALPLVKPVPASFSHSYNFMFAKYLEDRKIDSRFNLEWLQNNHSLTPSEAYAQLSVSYGGIDFNVFEVALSTYAFELFNGKSLGKDKTMKMLENGKKPEAQNSKVNFMFRAFDNMYSFLPIDLDANWLKTVGSKVESRGSNVKFFNPISTEISIPSEIGLPIVYEISLSMLASLEHDVNVTLPIEKDRAGHQVYKLCMETDLKASSKYTSRIKAFVPYTNETIMAGVDVVKKMNLPFNTTFSFSHQPGHAITYSDVQPLHNKTFSLYYSHTMPFTSKKPMFPGREGIYMSNTRVVMQAKTPLVQNHWNVNSDLLRLNASIDYEGDVSRPLPKMSLDDVIRQPERLLTLATASPTCRYWRLSFNYDPLSSQTKSIETALDYSEYTNRVSDLQKLSDIKKKHIQKLKIKNFDPSSFTKMLKTKFGSDVLQVVYALMGAMNLNSDQEPVQYMTLGGQSIREITNTSISKTSFLAFDIIKQNDFSQMESLLMDMETRVPNVNNYEDFERLLKEGIRTEVKGHMASVKYRTPKRKMVKFQGSMQLSDPVRDRLERDVRNSCLLDHQSIIEDLNTKLNYDVLALDVQYMPQYVWKGFMNAAYWVNDWARGFYFPYYQSDRMDVRNEEGKMSFSANRRLNFADYELRVKKPKENIKITNFQVPLRLNQIVNYRQLKPTLAERNFEPSSSFCDICGNKIKSFDGLDIQYPMSYCPTTVVTNISSWSVQTKYNDANEMEITLIDYSQFVMIKSTRKRILVNGKAIEFVENKTIKINNNLGSLLFEVTTHDMLTRINFVNILTIELISDSFRIYPESRIGGLINGACGNYDGKTANDKIGPLKCMYSNDRLFGASWVTRVPDAKCLSEKWLQKLVHQCEIYQKFCPKI